MVSLVMGGVFLVLIIIAMVFFIGRYFVGKDAKAGFIKVSGRMEAREYHGSTKIAGRVDEISVEEGDFVTAGSIIGQIYSQQLKAMLESKQAGLSQAQANFSLAKLEYKRYSRLYQGKAIAKMEYDYIINKYKQAKDSLVIAEKELDKAKADLEDTKIIAPISGVIVTKIVRKGEVVGTGTPLVTIVNMDDLYLKVFLSTELAGKVSLQNEAKIFPDAFPNEDFPAFVDRIAQKAEFTPKNVETKSQRAKLVFEIKLQVKKNKDYKLKPGMPAEGVIKLNDKVSWSDIR